MISKKIYEEWKNQPILHDEDMWKGRRRNMNIVAEKCLRYRAEHGLSQEQLAKRCGVSRFTIIKLENGGSLSKLSAYKVLIVVDGKGKADES